MAEALPDAALHEAFSRIARERPIATALLCGPSRITYGELEHLANEGAESLRADGLVAGDFVAIRSDRSIPLIVALLSVAKAGAAYALVDPRWPEQQVSHVLDILKPRLVLDLARGSGSGFPAEPPAGETAHRLGPRSAAVEGKYPCCVFFTSGTTGAPKAVLTSHRALSRLFRPPGFASFGPDTVLPLAAPPAWDAFALELWGALLSGGTSLIVEEPYLSSAALRSGINDHGVETVWLTSSLFNMLVEEDCCAFAGLRQVIVGGERLSVRHVRAFLHRHPDAALINGYGPVESAVFATTHHITLDDCSREHGIPLGVAVPGTRIFVLDGDRPCACGERGEICIAGDGLAIGYLGDPQLTEEKFPIVALDRSETRIYRTGDYGYVCEEGLLHFVGRGDRQVKIRGHRIEPAEVEARLESLLDSVRSCRVIPRFDDDGAAQELLAFCIPATPGDALEGGLDILRAHLPQYQIPAVLIGVDRFPLTPQGKIDGARLLELARRDAAAPGQLELASANGDIDRVASVMAEVLGRTSLPPSTSFFELGASSLDAGRVCSRLGTLFDHPVPLAWIYQSPSAEGLARRISCSRDRPGRPAISAPQGDVRLTSMQLLFLLRHLRNPSDLSSHCMLIWQITGDLDVPALEAAVNRVHERHEALHACYDLDPRPRAVVGAAGTASLTKLQPQPGLKSGIAALRSELARPLDPTTGSVWRVALAPLRPGGTNLFGCVVHHIAFDGWSESLLARDIAAGYRPTRRETASEPRPPPLAAANSEAVLAEREDGAGPSLRALVRELVEAPPVEWPEGRPSGCGIDCLEADVDVPAMAEATARASARGASRLAMLLSCLSRCLADVLGQDDLVVGVPVRTRGRLLDFAIGCHINMVCIRLGPKAHDEDGGLEHTETLIRRALAMSHRPLAQVLEEAHSEAPGRSPLYRIVFALQDSPPPELQLPGLETAFHRQPYLDLPVDLHVEAWPTEFGSLRLKLFSQSLPHPLPQRLLAEFVARLSRPAEATG